MEQKPHIQIIIGSTRKGRQGEKVGKWILNHVQNKEEATFELVDLEDFPLPFYNEPMPPKALSSGNYSDEAANRWVESVAKADGYIIAAPEYNHGYSAVLKNALDYVYKEWNNKPVAFVGYAGGSGGIRAIEQLRQVVIELKMIPLQEDVTIASVYRAFDEQGEVVDQSLVTRLDTMANAIIDWSSKLKQIRSI